MADPALTTGQYSIGTDGSSSAFVFGGRAGTFANSIQIASTQWDDDLTSQDTAVVGHDGLLFGIDTAGGMTITQIGQVNIPGQPAAAMDAFSALKAVWNDPAIRLQNSKMVVLRAFYPGSSVIRRTYGRGRKIIPVMGLAFQGLVPFTSQFMAAEAVWYSDVNNALTLTKVANIRGGVPSPWSAPFVLGSSTEFSAGTIINAGTLPTWPVITFTGLINNPGIMYVNAPVSVGYRGAIGIGDTLVIDTRPWARTVLLNGVSVAGRLTGDPMISLQLQPGSTAVRFLGQDLFGASTMTVRWRNSYQSIGGTLS
jgi:hypothetical protein